MQVPPAKEIENVCGLSVANATINTAVAAEVRDAKEKSIAAVKEVVVTEPSPKIRKHTGIGLERMESMSALAFDPRKAKPGPKRGSLL